ncbi:MAG TPA: phosphatidate cytidylyltransferase [Vicinamibacterales bacterium]|jgi:phosphatidate cytidylyltransferase|nr:phosphatidate cytidylyltransferase [Vicinamibacterales bacterium]
MSVYRDTTFFGLLCGVLALLVLASTIGWALSRRVVNDTDRATVDNINARIRAWWVMALVFTLSVATGALGSIFLFTFISFLALREFVTIAPTRPADHRALFWCFFVVTPFEYGLIWMGWYGLFSILIPVYVSIFVAIRTVLARDTERFLERTAITQWGLVICVYFVSYVPALLMLRIPAYEHQNAKLMFFLVLVVELSDILQYLWGKSIGDRRIAPSISPNKTWAGFLGGAVSATAAGAAIWWATPFGPGQAAVMAFVVTMMGFSGGLVMSAIKRDRGVKDYGSMINGHGGVLDRIDSLCFAAPVFFHLTRFFFAQ